MARIVWGQYGKHFYETGVDRGVLYVGTNPGVPWNGITSVSESPSGGSPKPFYLDGEKHSNLTTPEDFSATLTAYTYPDEFSVCDGTYSVRPGLLATRQRRVPFGLTYRTLVGNDLSHSFGYKIHLLYNATAAPSNQNHRSYGSSTSADDFSWKLTAVPPVISGFRSTAHVILDSRVLDSPVLASIEDVLYGNDTTAPRLPTVLDLLDIIDNHATITVVVTDEGDGTFTITGPSGDLDMLSDSLFQVSWSTVVDHGDGTYSISS